MGPGSPQNLQNTEVHNTLWESSDIVCLKAGDALEIWFSTFLFSHGVYLLGDSP